MIESIELLNETAVLFITTDEVTAKKLLKRNPKAQVTKADDDRYGLVYKIEDTNLMNAVKRS